MRANLSKSKSPSKRPAEAVVKDIRRATRRHFSAEDNIRIVHDAVLAAQPGNAVIAAQAIVHDPPSGVYGAKRQYHDDDTWADAVLTMMDDSRAIVCVLDHADGVWSEVEFLIRGGHHLKTLFIIPSRYSDRLLRGRLLPEFAAHAGAAGVPTTRRSCQNLAAAKNHLSAFTLTAAASF